MYGQIHAIVRDLVCEKFGETSWAAILTKSGFNEHEDFLIFQQYKDEKTMKLIGTVCEELGAPLATVLEIFGEYFLLYCLKHGYDKMLRTLGGDFSSFIQNLDSLHSLLAMTYKNIEAPSFRVEVKKDESMLLHYYTKRPGLYPIVLGLVRAVARDLYNQESTTEVVDISEKDVGGTVQQHVIFHVVLTHSDKKKMPTEHKSRTQSQETNNKAKKVINDKKTHVKPFCPVYPGKFNLSGKQFCNAFPYHMIFDDRLKIIQCGLMIQKLLPVKIHEGLLVTKCLELIHPHMEFSVDNIRMFINAVFMVKIRNPKLAEVRAANNGLIKDQQVILKGQMIWLDDVKRIIFICSPRLTNLMQLEEMNIYLSDIPLYDVTRELVLLNQQRIAEIDVAKELDETTAELMKTSKALETEKAKVDTLLHQMLPRKVAEQLKEGKRVDAESFDAVTILFSDIVTFTNIASACTPHHVVDMLNDMYERFDKRTEQHGVYKVETIGDAYMVVSGAPDRLEKHAGPVADFAMDMILEASQVKSPATGKPIQIRVGFHSGPVTAGVVGLKMPRYCLFGDTVNTASRMESHGVQSRIHISGSAYKALENQGFIFRNRGEMEIKGKGLMNTYFLVGVRGKRMFEPQNDVHYTLPLIGLDEGEEVPIASNFPAEYGSIRPDVISPEGKSDATTNSSHSSVQADIGTDNSSVISRGLESLPVSVSPNESLKSRDTPLTIQRQHDNGTIAHDNDALPQKDHSNLLHNSHSMHKINTKVDSKSKQTTTQKPETSKSCALL